jgi:zinc protease
VYGGDPGLYQEQLDIIAAATPKAVQDAAARWFGNPPYVAHIVPYPDLQANAESADRSILPEPKDPEPAQFPEFTRTTLENGLELVVIERPSVPVINLSLIFDAGYATDKPENAGEASFTMSMLDEGTKSLDSLEISEQLALLGANLSAGAGLDTASVSMSALTENLDESLDLFADVVLNPTFPEKEQERLRDQYLTAIKQEKSQPLSMALRLLPGLLYGEGHAYAQPLTGSGYETSIEAITRQNLIDWHTTWFRPNNATLVVVGDTTSEEITTKIDKLFNNWEPAEVPTKNITTVENADSVTLYLVDKPAAEQSIIFAGQLIVPMNNPNEVAIEAMNDILGGQFSARINMNLREEKSWSYGARSVVMSTQAQRPFFAYAPVQSDKTGPSLKEILREITEIQNINPPREDELQRVQRSNILSLPGRWETNPAVLSDLASILEYGLPDDYWDTYPEELNSLTLEQVKQAAANTLNPTKLTWVVVGDRARIEDELRDLGIGDIRLIDVDGNPVE